MSAPVFPDSPTVLVARERARARIADSCAATDVPVGDFSERLLRSFLALCENPRTRQGLLRLVRSSAGSARAGRALYQVLNRTVVNPAARATGVQASALRLELVAGQLVGLAMMRYVVQVEPVASAPADELVQQFAPAVRATLQGS